MNSKKWQRGNYTFDNWITLSIIWFVIIYCKRNLRMQLLFSCFFFFASDINISFSIYSGINFFLKKWQYKKKEVTNCTRQLLLYFSCQLDVYIQYLVGVLLTQLYYNFICIYKPNTRRKAGLNYSLRLIFVYSLEFRNPNGV